METIKSSKCMAISFSFQQKVTGNNGIFDVALTLALHQNRDELHWKKPLIGHKGPAIVDRPLVDRPVAGSSKRRRKKNPTFAGLGLGVVVYNRAGSSFLALALLTMAAAAPVTSPAVLASYVRKAVSCSSRLSPS